MRCTVIIFLSFVVLMFELQGVKYGSNSTPSRQTAVTFPAADGDNEMLGFGLFEGGFTLATSATTCVFNSVYPVLGTIALNGGTLTLSKNLLFANVMNWSTFGSIIGNNYSIEFPYTINSRILPSTVSRAFAFVQEVAAGDGVNCVAWASDSTYLAVGLDMDLGQNVVKIYSFNGTSFSAVTSANFNTVSIQNIDWHPYEYRFAAAGSASDEVRVYSFNTTNQTLTLTHSFNSGGGTVVRGVAWHPTGEYVAITRDSSSKSVIVYSHLNGQLTEVASIGVSPTRNLNRQAIAWDPTGNYLAVGTVADASAQELLVYQFTGNTLTLNSSAELGVNVQAITWSSAGPYLAVGTAAGTQTVRVYEHDPAGTLTEKTTARIGETVGIKSLHWHPSGTALALGATSGATQELRIYSFDLAAQTLTLVQGDDKSSSIEAVRWTVSGDYIAHGLESASGNNVGAYRFTVTPLSVQNSCLVLNGDVTLRAPLKFQGTCLVEGNGHVLDCTQASLIVDASASVALQNITLKGISTGTLYCVDSLGTFTLNSMTWIQDSPYHFTKGKIDIVDDVWMRGQTQFTYASDKVATIKSRSRWLFNTGMTFKYAPLIASNALLAMEDSTSVLQLRESTLRSTSAGLKLTKGTLIADGICPVINEGINATQGIMFGDTSDSFTIKALEESGLDVQLGYVVNSNAG